MKFGSDLAKQFLKKDVHIRSSMDKKNLPLLPIIGGSEMGKSFFFGFHWPYVS